MPKIIEILGPSGVGKTTLYKSLQNLWKEEYPWGVYHDIRYKRKPKRQFPQEYIEALRKRLQSSESKIEYKGLKQNRYPKERAFYEKYPQFCNRVVGLIDEHNRESFNGEDKRFINMYFMFETIEHIQAIRDRKYDNRACLMDEGLLSRIMHLNSPSFSERTVDEYIEYAPLPDAVIYLECSSEEILRRAQKKEKTSTVHRNLEEHEILKMTTKTRHIMKKTLQKMEKKGVRVYTLDAEREIPVLTSDVIEILEKETEDV